MKEDKQFEKDSSAEHVDEYLQTLGNEDARELRYYSQEQSFNSDELAKVVNEKRLNELLAQSDTFLRGLNDGIKDFENDNKDP